MELLQMTNSKQTDAIILQGKVIKFQADSIQYVGTAPLPTHTHHYKGGGLTSSNLAVRLRMKKFIKLVPHFLSYIFNIQKCTFLIFT